MADFVHAHLVFDARSMEIMTTAFKQVDAIDVDANLAVSSLRAHFFLRGVGVVCVVCEIPVRTLMVCVCVCAGGNETF